MAATFQELCNTQQMAESVYTASIKHVFAPPTPPPPASPLRTAGSRLEWVGGLECAVTPGLSCIYLHAGRGVDLVHRRVGQVLLIQRGSLVGRHLKSQV